MTNGHMSGLSARMRRALDTDAETLRAQLPGEASMISMLLSAFRSGMRPWAMLVWVEMLVVSIVFFWTAYEFCVAGPEGRIFWGAWMLLSALALAVQKLWFYMEASRASVMREVKRLELAILEAASTVDQD